MKCDLFSSCVLLVQMRLVNCMLGFLITTKGVLIILKVYFQSPIFPEDFVKLVKCHKFSKQTF